jgi:hypothetical protein
VSSSDDPVRFTRVYLSTGVFPRLARGSRGTREAREKHYRRLGVACRHQRNRHALPDFDDPPDHVLVMCMREAQQHPDQYEGWNPTRIPAWQSLNSVICGNARPISGWIPGVGFQSRVPATNALFQQGKKMEGISPTLGAYRDYSHGF